MPKGQRALLPLEEETRLRELATTGSETLQQRAKVVLDWHEGLTAAKSAQRLSLTENQVRYLLRLYQQKGLDLFLVDSASAGGARAIQRADSQPAPDIVAEAPDTISLEALCSQYQIDMAHAGHVAVQALALFDATANIHRLPTNLRPLLETAALVHNIGYGVDALNYDERGRDIVLAQPIQGFGDDERRMLACAVAFHRKKVYPDHEPVYTELPPELRQDALALAAILRIASGMDSTHNQITSITDIQVSQEEIVVVVGGPNGHNAADVRANAKQAQIKADLWNQIFTTHVYIYPVIEAAETPAVIPILSPTLNPTMSVTRAGRAFVMHTLDRIDALMKRLQNGDLGMLPALAREASRLTEAILVADAKDFRKETRWFLDSVEESRIAVTMVERAQILSDDPGEPGARAIAQKLPEWQVQAQAAIRAIDARRYAKLAADLRMALTEDIDFAEKALIVFHVGAMLWGQLAALRDVMENGTSVIEALEAARRLQDHLIAFRELLGSEAGQVLDMLAPLEGYLAAIHTIQVILGRLELPKPIKKGRKVITPPADPALETLRATQMEALNTLADSLPATWSAVNNQVFRRVFALAVAAP
jgi:hypothetical protein